MREFYVRRLSARDTTSVLQISTESRLENWPLNDYLAECTRPDSIALCLTTPTDECIGFLIARIVPGSSDRAAAELYNIGVFRNLRGLGGGRMLLNNFFDECSNFGVESIFLEVRESNKIAIDLYLKCGFEEIARRKALFSDPIENGIVMRLKLK